jgi:hypothetical protein
MSETRQLVVRQFIARIYERLHHDGKRRAAHLQQQLLAHEGALLGVPW